MTVSRNKQRFFETIESMCLALTYDDVLIAPARSFVPVADVSIKTRFSRGVSIKVPLVSAAMDTVTEADMAIAMAKLGGIGIIHAGLPVDVQRRMVRKVKLCLNGRIDRPITVRDNDTIYKVLRECDDKGFTFRTFPVTDQFGKLAGILTSSDILFCPDKTQTVSAVMTPASEVISAPEETDGISAYSLMIQHKKKTLPLLDKRGFVRGMYLFSDIARIIRGDQALYNTDAKGQLIVGAAVPTSDEALERVQAMASYVDVVVLDTAQGDSRYAFDTLEKLKATYPHIDVVVGNISSGESAKALAEAGADGIKVGQGGGSICTTRIETGMGRPMVSAIYACARAVEDYGIPVCADGGITNKGHVSIAIAAGADSVMMGRLLAGTDESPRDTIIRPDGSRVVEYRGMGSASAMRDMQSAKTRYGGTDDYQPLPEGVEAEVPYQGSVIPVIQDLCKALKKSFSYVGSRDIREHQENTEFYRVTQAGVIEAHPHTL